MTRWQMLERVLICAVLLDVFMAASSRASDSEHSSGALQSGSQTAKVLSVRTVLRDQYFVSRYPHTHYYILYISLSVSDQTYCFEYETPILDEIVDATSAINQKVVVDVKGKSVWIQAPKGHKLKAHLSKGTQC